MLKRSSSDDATSSLLDDLLDRLGSALLDMHNSLMPEHARKAADRDYDEVRAAIKAHATRSETREPEGYPGIAHDFETMRAALTHIAYGKWGDHESASSIATRALQSTPSATVDPERDQIAEDGFARMAAAMENIPVGTPLKIRVPDPHAQFAYGQRDDKHEQPKIVLIWNGMLVDLDTHGIDPQYFEGEDPIHLAVTPMLRGRAAVNWMESQATRSATREKNALEATGVAMMAQTDIVDGHSWVRRSPTGDKALDEIEWCQFCGTHKAEVPDWMDHPRCEALHLVRALYVHSEKI